MSQSASLSASAGMPRKSPLRVAAIQQPSFAGQRDAHLSAQQLRTMMIAEFGQWLRSRNNQETRGRAPGGTASTGLASTLAHLTDGS